jgi:hypothetical protein
VTEWEKFSSQQKLGLAVFVVIGLATAVLGFARIQKNIALPFVRKEGFVFKTTEELEREREQRLKIQDTDRDTLNDYDELYVFRTSPFLEDSDSDGTNDGQEVAANSDPNCPKGKTCRQPKLSTTQGTTTGVEASAVTPPTQQPAAPPAAPKEEQILLVITETFGDPAALTPEGIKTKLESMSSVELRTFLVKMGVPEKALQKADDATLRKLLEETLTEISAASQPAEGTPPATPPAP